MPDTPTEEVLRLQNEGMEDAEIIVSLTKKGFSPRQISEALNQAKIKSEVSEKEGEAAAGSAAEGLMPSIMAQPKVAEEIPSPQQEQPAEQEEVSAPSQGAEAGAESYGYEAPKIDTEAIEEIAEQIINERWQESKAKIDDISEWKDFTETRFRNFEERAKRIELALDRLQEALLGKVQEYSQNIKDIGSEISSLEESLGKVMPSLLEKSKSKEKSKKK